MIVHRPSGLFQCPLRGSCFAAAGPPYASAQAANEAVARYKACPQAEARRRQGEELYLRHLLLIGKALARFCHPAACYPGGCRVEDLIGDTYPVFREILDEYEPSYGVDFLGFASQRLYWRLEHRARRLERAMYRAAPLESVEPLSPSETTEERLLNRAMAQELLSHLDERDAALMTRYAAGHSGRELAESEGMSSAALRKRLERLRARLRSLSSPAASAEMLASDR